MEKEEHLRESKTSLVTEQGSCGLPSGLIPGASEGCRTFPRKMQGFQRRERLYLVSREVKRFVGFSYPEMVEVQLNVYCIFERGAQVPETEPG